MFQFNFLQKTEETKPKDEENACKEASEILLPLTTEITKNNYNLEKLELKDGAILNFISSQEVEKEICKDEESDVTKAYNANSDLVPNSYEGGLKLWECCFDLVHFLCGMSIDFNGLSVLELGCGAGLPGIFTLVKGANVHFQDYNAEVIKHLTIPNVFANQTDTVENKNCRFFSGDWSSLKDLLQSEDSSPRYDVILTSETIYSPDSYTKLHKLFEIALKTTGVIYVAAKTYYFGVGGGTRSFETFIEKEGIFKYRLVHATEIGVHREILELKFKDGDNQVS